MMAKTHIPIGIAASLVFSKVSNINPSVIFIGAAVLGSVLADIDHPSGVINQRVLLVRNKVFKTITYVMLAAVAAHLFYTNSNYDWMKYLVPLLLIIAFARHRAITHSILGAAIILWLIYKINAYTSVTNFYLPITIGYISHLFADLLTDKGLPLFFPYNKTIKLPVIAIKTNGWIEKVICVGAFLLCIKLAYPLLKVFKVI